MAKVDEIISEKKELDLKVKSLTEKVKTLGRQSAELSQTCKLLEKECKNLKGQREQEKERSPILQAAISHDFVSSLEGQDEKVKYYTGLPTYKCLRAVFDFTFPPQSHNDDKFTLTHFQQFVMTLMKLQLILGDHGDLVLADRRFTIDKSIGFYCAEVKTPPFTRGKPQLTKSEVDFSW